MMAIAGEAALTLTMVPPPCAGSGEPPARGARPCLHGVAAVRRWEHVNVCLLDLTQSSCTLRCTLYPSLLVWCGRVRHADMKFVYERVRQEEIFRRMAFDPSWQPAGGVVNVTASMVSWHDRWRPSGCRGVGRSLLSCCGDR
jgi:hypothetical protein